MMHDYPIELSPFARLVEGSDASSSARGFIRGNEFLQRVQSVS